MKDSRGDGRVDGSASYVTSDSMFQLNYNILMLAIHLSSVKILDYLYEQVIKPSPNPAQLKTKLLESTLNKGGIMASHLACMIGNLDVLRILRFKYDVDFDLPTAQGVSPLHCAAISQTGIVSIYFLEDTSFSFNVNIRDLHGASPLHYAIMNIEENNIQALLSLGAEINLQDNYGDSMLHVAIARYINDQENFGVYKEVIKEVL